MISRAELDELYRADDKARAERAEGLARREAQTRPFVRTQEETSADRSMGSWNAWMRGHLDIERQFIREEIEKALVDLIVLLRKDWEADIKHAIIKRDTKIARLEAQIETLTRMLSAPSKSIPNGRGLLLPDGSHRDV